MNGCRFFHHLRRNIVLGFVFVAVGSVCVGQEALNVRESAEQLRQKIVAKGIRYLDAAGQSDAGMFSDRVGPGVTALALTSAIRNGRSVQDRMVAKGLKALEGFVKPDGGIYGNGRLKNYETCVAMVCFAEANQAGKYTQILRNAKDFVTSVQYGKANKDPSDPWYGGASYGGSGRPDLSNTGYLIAALRAAETGENDPAIQAALAFVSRCQNLDDEFNDTRFANKIDDGGFYYEIPTTNIDPSTSSERYSPNGGLRSYGSMSYTGLKSMIYAGLKQDDPRVKAAVDWVKMHYDLETNPGMGTAGLYYYYHTFAAGLKAAGIEKLQDVDGREHDWRADLVSALASRQNADGSWSNSNRRWFENDKNLATAFALMALSYAAPAKSAGQ